MTHELTKTVELDTVTPVQYRILEYIAVSQPVTPSQISDCQQMSLPNTSRELKKLSKNKLIEKFTVPGDRRKQYICLSKDGEVMMANVFKYIENQFQKRIHNASKKELEDINKSLEILHTKLFY